MTDSWIRFVFSTWVAVVAALTEAAERSTPASSTPARVTVWLGSKAVKVLMMRSKPTTRSPVTSPLYGRTSIDVLPT